MGFGAERGENGKVAEPMPRDHERTQRVQEALRKAGWDALICARPSNVLMLSGYWPVIGTSIAVATKEGSLGLIVPQDEYELARTTEADELEIFTPGSLDEMVTAASQARPALARLAKKLKIERTSGFEHEEMYEPAPYAGVHFYSGSLRELLADAVPVKFVPADDVLSRLRAVLTSHELARLKIACRLAERAYVAGASQLAPGQTETEAASFFRTPLTHIQIGNERVQRADGFTYCMSGPNSAEAFAAYQRSRFRQIEKSDLVLLHCNSYADGYWTDITRTYCCGKPEARAEQLYQAVLTARRSAFEVIRPGVEASKVDRAAREAIGRYGFDKEFKHATGHGVGFAAINHLARPRLHPSSEDVLQVGMVFNVEPAAYIAGYGGLRHCDMVVVTQQGMELLTPFHTEARELVLETR